MIELSALTSIPISADSSDFTPPSSIATTVTLILLSAIALKAGAVCVSTLVLVSTFLLFLCCYFLP
ncbi:hypothetical protein IBE17_09190, partial [Francisella tularensis subsp. novicida]|nr:hypothetical protein [Francisella tularensis subsp. novicida]